MALVKNFSVKYIVTTLKHPHTLMTWLQLIFTCSLDLYQHLRGGAFVMLLTSLRMRRNSWWGFRKMASRNFLNTFTVADKMYSCTNGLFQRKCSLNGCKLLHFSELKWFREQFESTTSCFITSKHLRLKLH
jgi:hypothetical protein